MILEFLIALKGSRKRYDDIVHRNRRRDYETRLSGRLLILFLLICWIEMLAAGVNAQGFSIKVHSFNSSEAAQTELKRLLVLNQPAFILHHRLDNECFQIQIGRFRTRRAAEQYAGSLRRSQILGNYAVIGFDGPVDIPFVDSNAASSTGNNAPPRRRAAARSLQPYAARIRLRVGNQCDITFDTNISAVTILDPSIASGVITSQRVLTLTASAQGETMVVVTAAAGRRTFVAEVTSNPVKPGVKSSANSTTNQNQSSGSAGLLAIHFTPSFGGNPSAIAEQLSFTSQLNNSHAMKVNTEFFRLIGKQKAGQSFTGTNFGVNRIEFTMTGPTSTVDFADSELNISSLSLNGYTMRGFHLVTMPDSRFPSAELFAGVGRPSIKLFSDHGAYLAGGVIPVWRGTSGNVRAGLTAAWPVSNRTGSGGLSGNMNARLALDEGARLESEISLSGGGISGRGRIDLHRDRFDIMGEAYLLQKESPFVAIGAQSGGRKGGLFAVQWRPSRSLSGSVSYNFSKVSPPSRNDHDALNTTTLLAGANYTFNSISRLGIQYSEQGIETGVLGSNFGINLKTRSIGLTHNLNSEKVVSNSLEARITESREIRAGAEIERGATLREEFRLSFRRWSATSYFYHANNTPSIASLIIRNPLLLPPILRESFEANPLRFLDENHALLQDLLSGVLLPVVRSNDIGIRLEGAISRFTIMSDLRLSDGEITAQRHKDWLGLLGLTARLNENNVLQVNLSEFMPLNSSKGFTALSLSYTHRFGQQQGVIFALKSLFGHNRSHLGGRVFYDANGNGEDDPGEAGAQGMQVQLDGSSIVTTDALGHFQFPASVPGEHTLKLISSALGVDLRASTPSEQTVWLSGKEELNLAFGITNHGFVAGRVFNDLLLTGEQRAEHAPGVGGVTLRLRQTEARTNVSTMTYTVDSSGVYEFRNLAPGNYVVELLTDTLPPNFLVPSQTKWPIIVEPLRGVYLDLPVSAQRAVSGVVYLDRDGNGHFDPQVDTPVAGARVIAGKAESITNDAGVYTLRYLPAGKTEIEAYTPDSSRKARANIDIGAEPALIQPFNLGIVWQEGSSSSQRNQR